jgi:anhydro-N-acetylmuramic acid kinase
MTLMQMLARALAPYKCRVMTTDAFGIPAQAKEAVAFALLAYETWHHRPSNVPAATGAKRPVILGQVIYSA